MTKTERNRELTFKLNSFIGKEFLLRQSITRLAEQEELVNKQKALINKQKSDYENQLRLVDVSQRLIRKNIYDLMKDKKMEF